VQSQHPSSNVGFKEKVEEGRWGKSFRKGDRAKGTKRGQGGGKTKEPEGLKNKKGAGHFDRYAWLSH